MKNKVNKIISTFKDFHDPRVNWEYLKFKMRGFSRHTFLNQERKLEKNYTLKLKILRKTIVLLLTI